MKIKLIMFYVIPVIFLTSCVAFESSPPPATTYPATPSVTSPAEPVIMPATTEPAKPYY